MKAQEQFLKAVELTPDIYFAWIALAQIQFKERNFAKTKEYALKAEQYGFDETLYFLLGATTANERILSAAEEYLRKSLKLDPKNVTTLTFLSTVCMERGKSPRSTILVDTCQTSTCTIFVKYIIIILS